MFKGQPIIDDVRADELLQLIVSNVSFRRWVDLSSDTGFLIFLAWYCFALLAIALSSGVLKHEDSAEDQGNLG